VTAKNDLGKLSRTGNFLALLLTSSFEYTHCLTRPTLTQDSWYLPRDAKQKV
jgi:hypothetical protein